MQDKKTKYQLSYEEWDKRIGNARIQARNWMIASFFSLVVCIIMLIMIFIILSARKNYVYIAEIKPGESVINVKPIESAYFPTTLQKISFISRFIQNVTEIPLDPVVLNKRWNEALLQVMDKAEFQLKNLYEQEQPFDDINKKTILTSIINANEISDNSFDISFKTVSYNSNGDIEETAIYNGIFTLSSNRVLVSTENLNKAIVNPLGLKIIFFSFSKRG